MKVGFIGLGTMGAGIALNAIRAGHGLAVHDVNRDAAAPALAAGATWADSPRAAAEGAEVVLTSLPGPKEVEAVALGERGLREGLGRGAVYADLSTNSPTLVRRLHATLGADGVDVLDAPVSGGPDGARSGRLAIWGGGDEAAFERALPVLTSVADQPMYVGPIGAGSVAKLVHNLSGYVIQTALAETFTMGVKAGLPADALWQAVRQGALGRRRTFDSLARQFLPGRFDPPDFALRLARKDVTLALEVGREFEVPMRLGQLTLEEMVEACNRGWSERDSRIAMTLQEERAGVEVRVAPGRIDQITGED